MSLTEKQYSVSSDSSVTLSDPFKLAHRVQPSQTIDDKALALFQPDVLLPSQYLATTKRKLLSQPEKKLMLAILEDAVVSFQKFLFAQKGKRKNLFRDAEEWLFQENGHWVFSFESICDALGLNPSYLRKGLKEWMGKQLAQDNRAKVYPLRSKEELGRSMDSSRAKKHKYLKAAGC